MSEMLFETSRGFEDRLWVREADPLRVQVGVGSSYRHINKDDARVLAEALLKWAGGDEQVLCTNCGASTYARELHYSSAWAKFTCDRCENHVVLCPQCRQKWEEGCPLCTHAE